MATIAAYHRPVALDGALDLLARPRAVVLAGGTRLVPAASEPVEVVDLQALGLDTVTVAAADALVLGATATLQQLVETPIVPADLREAARREVPSTLRNAATVGGIVAVGDHDSELLATLLVHEAVVTIAGSAGAVEVPLATVLADRRLLAGRIATAVTVDPRGTTVAARTARTAADRPIVAAVARRAPGGEVRLALSGVAATPVLVTDLDRLDPPADFRGSAEYRRSLARTLAARVMEALA
jgi:CO/xanthine dehydrogenase FAD-binding subunit